MVGEQQEVLAPGWVITMPNAHFRYLKLSDLVYSVVFSLPMRVYLSFKWCKAEETGIAFSAYLRILNPYCIQGKNPHFHFFDVTVFLKIRHKKHESVPYMPLVSYMQ